MAGAGGSELPGSYTPRRSGARFPSTAAQAQAAGGRTAGGTACSGRHGPSGMGQSPKLVSTATRVPHTGGGGAFLTRTTSNRVPPAPLSADADAGTPDLASARRKWRHQHVVSRAADLRAQNRSVRRLQEVVGVVDQGRSPSLKD